MPETTSSQQHLLANIHESPGSQWLIREVHDRRENLRRQLEGHRNTDTMIDIAFKQGQIKALSDVLDMPGLLRQEVDEDEDE